MIVVEIYLIPKILVACIYIPPNCSDMYHAEVIRSINNLNFTCDVIVSGDFNCPDINWSTLTGTHHFSKSLCDVVFANNLMQHVSESTHIHGNCLDLILTNCQDRMSDFMVDSTTNSTLSDHYLVSAWIAVKNNLSAKRGDEWRFNFALADFQDVDMHLAGKDFSRCFHAESIESAWFELKSIIMSVCRELIPSSPIPSYNNPVWFTAGIRHLLNCIHSARRQVKSCDTPVRRAKVTVLEQKLQVKIDEARLEYETGLVTTFHSNPTKLYRHLSSLSKSKSRTQFIVHNGSPVHNPRDKVNIFNQFFNSTFTASDYVLPATDSLPSPAKQLSNFSIDAFDVYRALIELDPHKAAGCDEINPSLLKYCATSLTDPIAHLLSLSLSTGVIPQEWKVHKITPVPKKGDKSNPSNYRPISLLCIISKVMESIVFKVMAPFLRPQVSKHQFGFLKNRSCLTELLLSFSVIIEALENRKSCNAVYVDFRKAFDSVPHQELLYKLWRMGITGPLWIWIKAYLSNRHHYVCIDGTSSGRLPVLSGVPQGSILGPLLFIVYVNDIPDAITHSSLFMFADDTKFIKCVSNFNDCLLMQEDLVSFTNWCKAWKLKLHQDKCVLLRFQHATHEQADLYIDGSQLNQAEAHRDLGVVVCQDLSWSDHYSAICTKAYASLHLIRRNISPLSGTEIKKTLYLTLVRSHLSYCSQLWRPMLIKDIQLLEQVQRRATKFITNDYAADYKERLKRLKLLPLMHWYELQDIMFLVKTIKNPPDNFNVYDHLSFSSSTTRAASLHHMKAKFCRLSVTRHFYFNRVTRLWNSLPKINLSLSETSIRKHVRDHLWNHFTQFFNPSNACTFHTVCPCSNCHLSNPCPTTYAPHHVN